MTFSTTSRAPDSAPRSRMVDSWRAIACLSVVFFHGSMAVADAKVYLALAAVAAVGRQLGWLGVPMFFVISGYCLAQAVEKRAAKGTGPLLFLGDRIARIYPVYWAAFFISILLAFIATRFNGLPPSSAFPASASAWWINLGLLTSWFHLSPQLGVSWSLDFEMAFYVLVGGALLPPLLPPHRRLWFYAGLTLCAFIPGLPAWLWVLRAWPQFACGIAVHTALASSLPRSVRLTAGLSLAAFAGYYLATGQPLTAFAALFALLFLVTLAVETKIPRLPASLATIGLASYSIYLIHVPVMSPAINLARRALPSEGLTFALAWCAHLALGVGAGLLFHRLVERPCEKFRARLFKPAKASPSLNSAKPSPVA